jgi:ABC-type lipoprotein release transport system permease subunit
MFTLAVRNLWRDRRRTITTILALCAGMLALVLFLAYVEFVEESLAKVVIFAQGNGHVQVYRKGGIANLSAFPARYSIDASEQKMITDQARGISGVRRVGVDMSGVGSIQHGTKDAVFLATGVVPDFDAALERDGGLTHTVNSGLASDTVLLTPALADLIGAVRGDDVQLVGASYGNRINAIDATFAGFFSTGIEVTEDKGLKMPLNLMQSLYDTDAVSRLVIELDDRTHTPQVTAALEGALARVAPGRFEVSTWDSPQVGQLYTSFMGFFQMLFTFTGVIIALIAVTTIQHTVSMNIDDRSPEIATLRSIGFPRDRMVWIFVYETLLTVLIVCALTFVIAIATFLLLRGFGVTTTLPRIAQPVPLALSLPATHMLALIAGTGLLIVATSALTTWRRLRRTRHLGRAPGVTLLRELTGSVAGLVCCVMLLHPVPSSAAEGTPDQNAMAGWLREADLARGGFGNYSWTVKIHSHEPTGDSDTTYDVVARGGDALARTTEPKRYQGERILIASHAMWYTKPGLRRPISVSPQQRLVGEAANGDIASTQYSRDYTPEYVGETQINGHDCYKLKLTASRSDVTYAAITYFLDKRTLLGVKADFMTASGDVFKSAAFEYENRIDTNGKSVPFMSTMTITNASFPDRFSRLEYSGVHTSNNPESMFSLGNFS